MPLVRWVSLGWCPVCEVVSGQFKKVRRNLKSMQVPVIYAPPSTPAQMGPSLQVPVAVPVASRTPVVPCSISSAPFAITSQPQPQTSVTLNMQPTSHMFHTMGMGPGEGPMAFGPISWATGLFQCFEDIPMCILGCLCPCVLPCYLSALFGEMCCFGMLPGSMFALRTGVRERYRIPGNLLNDYCAVCCCLACALCQMAREMKGRDWQNQRFPKPGSHNGQLQQSWGNR